MKRCLIVDDSSVIRLVAKRILAGSDMLVAEAATGQTAFDICANEMPDIIVVDYRLPDVDSCELIGRIAKLESENKPQILLLACEFDVGLIMRARRAGAAGYLMKPFTRSHFLETFRELQAVA